MEIIKLKIADLTPYENNAKTHPKKQIEEIKNSIKQFGFCDPVGIWGEKNIIVEGHGRVLALQEMGETEVECIRLDHLTDEERKAYTLAHNKTTLSSDFDFDKLEAELKALSESDFDFSMEDFGFDLSEFEEPKEVVEDEAPEVDEDSEPITQLGDIWQLGEHRLMCGDSTDALNINILMNGNKADLVFTDPPYGMKKEKDGVANDNLNYDDLLAFNKQWIPLTFDALKDNGSWYCWGIDEPLMDIYSDILKPMIRENKITFRNLITWDKGSGQGQLSSEFRMYPIADEKCLFVMLGQQHLSETQDKWTGEFDWLLNYLNNEIEKIGLKKGRQYEQFMGSTNKSQHHLSKSHFGLMQKEDYLKLQNEAKMKGIKAFEREYEDIKREYYSNRSYFDNTHDNMNNVWHFSKTSGEERELTGGHATPKPIALCSRAIKSSSREGEIVLDVFGGSGSTLIACEQLNRKAYLMELEPKWCDVIVKRWETLTGKKAVKL